ncbi:hypothetical protein N9M19_04940 [Gammaproteobacteria bacterium]|nr:hypothetical protein [Gammaproteobacteria bacterium]
MTSVTNIKVFKEGTRLEFVEYIARILDLAVDEYDEIVIEVEERSQNTKAGIEFIFGEGHLEERQQIWTALSLTIDGIFERYRSKHSEDKDYKKLYELYKTLEVEYEDLFDEHI